MSSFQGIDAQSLITAHTLISFVTAPFLSPTYNFPLFLYGLYATDRTDSVESLRLFSAGLAASVAFDIIWLAKTRGQSGFIMMLTIINLILKIPTIFAAITSLRMRGDSFTASFSGGQLAGGQNVWSMPGGFGGRDGYQNVDDDLEGASTPPHLPPTAPPKAPVPQHSSAPAPPGGYQTL